MIQFFKSILKVFQEAIHSKYSNGESAFWDYLTRNLSYVWYHYTHDYSITRMMFESQMDVVKGIKSHDEHIQLVRPFFGVKW